MITASFYHNTTQLRLLQDLVKRYDGRFLCNPFIIGERARVTLSFDDGRNYQRFSCMCNIIQQKYY